MLISPEYVALNAEHHRIVQSYGAIGGNSANLVYLADQMRTRDILDYGCGKGNLARHMPWPIKEYDPAIPGKNAAPEPADIVICRDVLEHVEPECLNAVLADLSRCVKRIGLFSTVTGPSWDVLPDGRNAHLIQRPWEWWKEKLSAHFSVGGGQEWQQISRYGEQMFIGSTAIFVIVTPKRKENGHG